MSTYKECGYASQAEMDKEMEHRVSEACAMDDACNGIRMLSDAEFSALVADAGRGHPLWWSCGRWLETLKWEAAFRADLAKLKHYSQ